MSFVPSAPHPNVHTLRPPYVEAGYQAARQVYPKVVLVRDFIWSLPGFANDPDRYIEQAGTLEVLEAQFNAALEALSMPYSDVSVVVAAAQDRVRVASE